MDRQKRIWWVLSAVVIAAAATYSAGTVLTVMLQKQWARTDAYAADQVKSLVLETGSARIHVVPVRQGSATVTQTDRWVVSRPRVDDSFDPATGTLRVSTSCKAMEFVLDSCDVQLDIAVPASTRISADGGSGTLAIGYMTGPLTAQFGSGEIDLDHDSGPIDARVSSGQVQGVYLGSTRVTAAADSGQVSLDFAVPPASVIANASSGEVMVGVPRGTQYRVTASADSGATSVDPGLSSSSGAGTVTVSVNSGRTDVYYR